MDDEFVSGRFRFQVEGSDWLSDQERGFSEVFVDDAFDLRLTGTGKIPDLGGGPVASWILARLARLTDDGLGMGEVEYVDGGGYVVEFVVYLTHVEPKQERLPFVQPLLFDLDELGLHVLPDRPLASFQFQGDMEGVGVIGWRDPDCPTEEVLAALAAAFLAAPTDLRCFTVAVKDPEWKLDPEIYTPRPRKGSRNWYGWDGVQFLGRYNIREEDFPV